MTHTCNSRCQGDSHLEVAYAQIQITQDDFETALQQIVADGVQVRVLREVREYAIPDELRWIDGIHATELLTDYPPAIAFLVEYRFI